MSDKTNEPIGEGAGEPDANRSESDEPKVGPCRPPRQYTWKKGGPSPNPKGRPRKDATLKPDLKQALETALSRKVTLTKGDRERTLTLATMGIEQMVAQFAKGDRHARRDTFDLAQKLGIDLAGHKQAIEDALAPAPQAILDSYFHRRASETSAAAPEPVIAPPELRDDDAATAKLPPDQPAVPVPKPPPKTAQQIHDERRRAKVELRRKLRGEI
jgi:hypothetical protein